MTMKAENCSCYPMNCFLPPNILERLAESDDRELRQIAVETIRFSEAFRTVRTLTGSMAMAKMFAVPSPAGTKDRLVYDMKNSNSTFRLPGKLVRSEGEGTVDDAATDEAYDFSGDTYEFYKTVFKRNSIDDRGMKLISSVHFGRRYNNAFWNGEQMVYGDGDGRIFIRFTRSLDVVAHELTHGVVQHTSNLEYQDEPGALNEHFADVMGTLVKQWRQNKAVNDADWYIGGDIMAPALGVKGLRTFLAEKAYANHPILGTDPQPKHMNDKYIGDDDNGGVHWNSGICNHAFYLVAQGFGGYAWEKAGHIWYQTLLRLNEKSIFGEMAEITREVASRLYGSQGNTIVTSAWKKVGVGIG